MKKSITLKIKNEFLTIEAFMDVTGTKKSKEKENWNNKLRILVKRHKKPHSDDFCTQIKEFHIMT